MKNYLAGTKIIVGMNAGLAGTDAYAFFELINDMTEFELEEMAWQMGLDNAANYNVYPVCDDTKNDREYQGWGFNQYSSNDIEGWFEVYNPKAHDMHSMTGNPEFQKI